MTILTSANGSLPLTLRKGETLVVRNYSGAETVRGSTVPPEATSDGAEVYGPQISDVSIILSSSGALDYQTVMGDMTIGRKEEGPIRVVIDGDSFAANGVFRDSVQHLWTVRGWWVHALSYIRGNIRVLNMGGVGGMTAQQILARFDTQVAPFAPCEVWAIIGQNNLPDTDGGAGAVQAIQQYAQKCRELGCTLRLGTVTPRHGSNQTTTIRDNVIAINEAIRGLARVGVCKVFDSHAVMADPASSTGAARTGSTYDEGSVGLHPNAQSASRIGREFARRFASEFQNIRVRPSAVTDSRQVTTSSKQLVLNPKLSGASATAGTGASGAEPTSWLMSRRQGSNITVTGAGNQSEVDIAAAIAGSASGTYGATEQGLINSLIAGYNSLRQAVSGNTGNIGRSWFRMTVAGTASGAEIVGIQQAAVTLSSMLAPVTGGVDRVEAARISARCVGLSSNFRSLTMRVEALNGSTPLFTVEGCSDVNDAQTEMPDGEFLIDCPGFDIPATTTRLRVTVQATFNSGACAGDIFLTDCDIRIA
jgi:hypothetical protein